MKRTILFSMAMFTMAILPSHAQWIRVWQQGESTHTKLANAATIPYTADGQTITINGKAYSTAEIDSITIVNPVTIAWDGTNAVVTIPDNVEGVTATVTNGNVVITNNNTWSEQEFVLSGTGTGSLTYNGEYKVKFHLNGVNLTATNGAALDIQCGKRIDLILEDGTTNSLTDAASGTQKAALNCQGHMEVSGSGSLAIAGKKGHGLRTKEYLLLKKSTGNITISEAKGDAIHCGEYFTMNGGTVTLKGYSSDGLQMETATKSEEENNGIFTMNGGTLNITHSSRGSKAVRADGTKAVMNINGGTINITLTETSIDSKGLTCDGAINIDQSNETTTTILVDVLSDGYYDSKEEETVRTTGIKAATTFTLKGGAVTLNAKGKYARGLRAYSLIMSGGSLTINATGDNSDYIKIYNSDQKTITGGTINDGVSITYDN